MMRTLRLLPALLLVVGGLAACTITVTYTPPPVYTNITADATAPGNPTGTVSVAANATVDFRVSMSQVSAALFHAEAVGNQPVTVLVMDSNGQPLASSASSTYFVGGLGAASLALPSAQVAPAAIATSDVCNGPCVLVPAQSAYYYVEIRNTASSSATVNLWFYGTPYGDAYETGNNSRTGTPATLTSTTGSESGAIETVGDVDYWKTVDSGSWQFDTANNGYDITVYILDTNGQVRDGPYHNGDRIPAYGGWTYEIYSGLNRAGIAAKSAYYFSAFQ